MLEKIYLSVALNKGLQQYVGAPTERGAFLARRYMKQGISRARVWKKVEKNDIQDFKRA